MDFSTKQASAALQDEVSPSPLFSLSISPVSPFRAVTTGEIVDIGGMSECMKSRNK